MNPACSCPTGMCGGACGGSCGGPCPIMMTLMFILWFLISSGLLYYAWNKVINYLFSTKLIKFWQALLLIATLAFICSPKYLMHKKDHFGKKGCPMMSKGMKKDCPMHGKMKMMDEDEKGPEEHP